MRGTSNHMLNVSDGGHIENLAAYELLRRRCKLIIASDCGEDPNFDFADLENLVIRARNELGIEIRFRDSEVPEHVMRPKPSQGYSKKRFCIAKTYAHWKEDSTKGTVENLDEPEHIGFFIYVKSTVTPPVGKPPLKRPDPKPMSEYTDEDLRYYTYKYKIYHPSFPHESTADQFFDPIQWEAYFQLGQFIGCDLLGISALAFEKFNKGDLARPDIDIQDLIDRFDCGKELFDEAVSGVSATRTVPKRGESYGAPADEHSVTYQM
jgi:hypothetical protein